MSNPISQIHIRQLDGLRCLAILMVLFGHWIQWNISWKPIALYSFNNGVTLFFVLSGFLITGILLDHKELQEKESRARFSFIRSFFFRRVLRIFPIYYLYIAVLWLMHDEVVREFLPWFLTYSINIYQAATEVSLGKLVHLWSLSVEEQFYLFWPFIIALVNRRNIPRLLISLIVLSLIYKGWCYSIGNWIAGGYVTFGCMDALSLGGLIAFLHRLPENKWRHKLERFPAFVVLLVQATMIITTRYYDFQWFGFILDTFLFAVFSALLVNRAAGSGLKGLAGWFTSNNASVYIGKISYGIYLYHTATPYILDWISGRLGIQNWNQINYNLAQLLLVILIAQVSWMVIEKPINSLKRYFKY